MSKKADTDSGGLLADIRSFVYTAVVVAVGFAFIAALFTGGFAGAGDQLSTVFDGLMSIVRSALDTVQGFVDGASQ